MNTEALEKLRAAIITIAECASNSRFTTTPNEVVDCIEGQLFSEEESSEIREFIERNP